MSLFAVNQTVYRKEDHPTVEATVREISEDEGRVTYLIDYIEGGSGWWPETSLTDVRP